MMRTTSLFGCLLFATACVDSGPKSTVPSEPVSTIKQAVVDPGGPNWLALGGSTFAEQVGGTDGEPDIISGRFVLDADPVTVVSSGFNQWVVLGNGNLQALDDDAQRVREKRDALSGDAFSFAKTVESGWIAGGQNGRLQLLDTSGEPTASQLQVLQNNEVIDADFSGVSYLALGSNGNITVVNANFTAPANPDGSLAFVAGDGHSVVSNGDNGVDPAWIAVGNGAYVTVNAAGTPSAEIPLPKSSSAASFINGQVFVGNVDGTVSVSAYGTTLAFSENTVLDEPVREIVEGPTNHLVIGASGKIRTVDANGVAVSGLVEFGSTIIGAHGTDTGWWLVGTDSVARFVDTNLVRPVVLSPLLNGERMLAADVGAPGVLVVGENGAYQLLDETGGSISVSATIGGGNLNSVSWNGSNFLVVGDGGFAQLINEQGNPEGSSQTYLEGDDVNFAAWSGELWLVGGAGKVQLIREDGTPQADPRTLDATATFYDAQWEGTQWLVVGERNGESAYGFVSPDTNVEPTLENYPLMTKFNVAEFDGREWIAGGSDGQILRISSGGQPTGGPITILERNEIQSIYFNGRNLMVGGQNGAIRRIGADFIPLRTSISVVDGGDVMGVIWSIPRGFAEGPCLTSDSCFAGPCVGGLAEGSCCDRACDKPCESCFENDTGETDGTCAPVVANKRPPSGSAGCSAEPEATCGRTGFCDGAGECELYSDDVQCETATCEVVGFTGPGVCDGGGACTIPTLSDCSPYTGCSTDTGCATSCSADADCVDGFECRDSQCLEPIVEPEPEPEPEPEDDSGCCATTPSPSTPTWWFVVIVGGLLVWRRRIGK